jgi:hypothetical protein
MMLKQPSWLRRGTYVIVIVSVSGSGLILISISEPSASIDESVTLRNLSLSNASLALLGENIKIRPHEIVNSDSDF